MDQLANQLNTALHVADTRKCNCTSCFIDDFKMYSQPMINIPEEYLAIVKASALSVIRSEMVCANRHNGQIVIPCIYRTGEIKSNTPGHMEDAFIVTLKYPDCAARISVSFLVSDVTRGLETGQIVNGKIQVTGYTCQI
jgi:hypothetical protein